MSTPHAPGTIDVLRSLRLLRSDEAAERRRGIAVLSTLHEDPRVRQVLEYLYEKDLDPGVRLMAWDVLNEHAPSVPAPGPSDSAQNPALAAQILKRTSVAGQRIASPPSTRSASPALFLLNPHNARFVVRETRKLARRRQRSRMAFVISGVLLLVVGVLWGLALPDVVEWYESVRDSGAIPHDATHDQVFIVASGLTVVLVPLLLLGVSQRRPGSVGRGKHLIRGQMVSCTSFIDGDGDFNIKLRFRFRSPTGKAILGQTSRIRNDLKTASLPGEGAAVAVFYKNDRSYVLL